MRVIGALAFVLATFSIGQLPPLGGTQPNELTTPPDPSSGCGCHLDYSPDVATEPGQSYAATAMALSARDPLFRAALAVAYQDRPELTSNCLRCHAPRGWLSGRAMPGDGSLLTESDLDGVTCDVCHRMVPPAQLLIGAGQYTLAQSTSKLGPRVAQPMSGHAAQRSSYLGTSEACAPCHSLFNPLERHHNPTGSEYGYEFYEQRTYEEWRDSSFNAPGKQCPDCHMKRVSGFNCSEQINLYPDLRVHTFVGGNSFVARAVSALYPQLGLQDRVTEIRAATAASLASAARLEIIRPTATVAEAEQGRPFPLRIRFTNLTGHKLPTGYPEGRRIYLEVTLSLQGRSLSLVSGAWDRDTGNVILDPQIRTYEAGHGILGIGRSFHLALANQTIYDTRIPPEGYNPLHPDMSPVGRDYGSAPHRNYDEHEYQIMIPADVPISTTGTITVRALRQALTGQYYDFLQAELPDGNVAKENLRRVYSLLGKVPPEQMTLVTQKIVVVPAQVQMMPDSGVIDSGSAPDSGVRFDEDSSGGCGCRATRSSRASAWVFIVALTVLRRRFRR